ncbi:MAG: hypothetical protein V4505_05425 [Pseudomonadota bacterium]
MKQLRKISTFTALSIALLLAASAAGCSGADGKIYDAYKCGKVATILGRGGQGRTAGLKIKPLLDEMEKQGVDQSQYLMRLMDKFTDDLALYKLSPAGQAQAVLDTYESSTCQKLYRP